MSSGAEDGAPARPLYRDPLLGVIIFAGVLARSLQYLSGASLSSDEAMLALNVVRRSFAGLFDRLDFNQAAPLGLLVAEKAATSAAGGTDLAVRAVPFAAGLAALALFPFLAARVLDSRAAMLLATLLFALSDPLIYWTATDKQYAVDVLAAVLIPLLALRVAERDDRTAWLELAAAGVVAPFFSHASLFVTAGALGALALTGVLRRAPAALIATASASAISFLVAYFLARSDLQGIQTSLSGTPGAFAEGSDPGVLHSLLGAFRYVIGIPPIFPHGARDGGELVAVLAIVFCLCGIVALARRAPVRALVLFAPVPLWAAASVAGRYPLLPRTMLFFLPQAMLALTAGIAQIARIHRRVALVAAAAAALIVVTTSMAAAVKHVASPRTRQQIEPALAYLAAHQRPGDGLYIFYKAQYGFAFYEGCDCARASVRKARRAGLWPVERGPGGAAQWAAALASTDPRRLVVGSRASDDHASRLDLERLRGRGRVWFVVSDLPKARRAELLETLDRVASRRSTYVTGDDESAAHVYLYRFPQP